MYTLRIVLPELVPGTEPPGKTELFVPVLPVLLEPPVVPEFPVFPESPLFSESVELRSAIFFIVSDWKVSVLSSWIPYQVNEEGKYTYTVPVEALDKEIAVAAYSFVPIYR